MDETIKAIDEHVSAIDKNTTKNTDWQAAAGFAQAKSMALLAKVIAAGIKEATEAE